MPDSSDESQSNSANSPLDRPLLLGLLGRVRPIAQRLIPSAIYAPVRNIVWRRVALSIGKAQYVVSRALGARYDEAPPVYLRAQYGPLDRTKFLEYGRASARMIEHHVREAGLSIEEGARVLDFGCGCGRVMQAFGGRYVLFGCDLKGDPIDWIRRHHPSWRVVQNQDLPPLPSEFRAFDLVYAISVFTHMTENQADAWMRHLGERIRPAGTLFITVLDPSQAEYVRRFGLSRVSHVDFHYDSGKHITFLSRKYLEERWGSLFELRSYGPALGYTQTAAVLTRR